LPPDHEVNGFALSHNPAMCPPSHGLETPNLWAQINFISWLISGVTYSPGKLTYTHVVEEMPALGEGLLFQSPLTKSIRNTPAQWDVTELEDGSLLSVDNTHPVQRQGPNQMIAWGSKTVCYKDGDCSPAQRRTSIAQRDIWQWRGYFANGFVSTGAGRYPNGCPGFWGLLALKVFWETMTHASLSSLPFL
jgi:hypothetical protein